VYLFRHPFLTGQVSKASPIDQIDVSKSLKLNDEYFNATPVNDSALQETLVDGSVITVTNHLMNGTAALKVVPTTGLVGTGDLIAGAHLIVASKDDVGGTLTRIRWVNGKKLVRIYYGVSFKNVPHEIDAGNAVPIYNIVMLYSGWVEAVGAAEQATKTIWAVGNKYGLKAAFRQYGIQEGEDFTDDVYTGKPITSTTEGVGGTGNGDDDTGMDAGGGITEAGITATGDLGLNGAGTAHKEGNTNNNTNNNTNDDTPSD
jgi:hypothetical protein